MDLYSLFWLFSDIFLVLKIANVTLDRVSNIQGDSFEKNKSNEL